MPSCTQKIPPEYLLPTTVFLGPSAIRFPAAEAADLLRARSSSLGLSVTKIYRFGWWHFSHPSRARAAYAISESRERTNWAKTRALYKGTVW
jgi:hypothetical protein